MKHTLADEITIEIMDDDAYRKQLQDKAKILNEELIHIALAMAALGKQLSDKKDELNFTLIRLNKIKKNAANQAIPKVKGV